VPPNAEKTRLRTATILAAAFSAALAIGLTVGTVAADAKTYAHHRHWRTLYHASVGYGFGTAVATGVAGPAVPAATSPLFAQGVFERYPGPDYGDYRYYTHHPALNSHIK
jgi:hypothetical protein